jgi:hypothetical protein
MADSVELARSVNSTCEKCKELEKEVDSLRKEMMMSSSTSLVRERLINSL